MAKNVEPLPAATAAQLPIPPYLSLPVAILSGKDGETFSIVLGLDQNLIRELKEKSLDTSDTELQRNTSDYARFGTGAYETWYAKGRVPFAALDAQGRLAAIIWYGPDAFPQKLGDASDPQAWDTIAFRSYTPHRGKGIMSPFSAFVIEMHDRLSPGRLLWLETNADNEPGKALYYKLGFSDAGRRKDNGRLRMIRR
jgi:GNAT superfamily N-acetyltransferase